jgi:4-hydroxy-tetrahydrodipicolinate reductase
MKRVVIVGGAGRMGQAMAEGLGAQADIQVVGLVDMNQPRELFGAVYQKSLSDFNATDVDVVVDFSSPESVELSAAWCADNHVPLVIGTTGLSDAQRDAVREAASKTGVVLASNFSLGAVLSERFAAMAAPYFERVEIIELHHDKKVDAPSGTSLTTAHGIAEARRAAGQNPLVDPTVRNTHEGARGADVYDGIKIHSVRLPGLVAHQEVLFGGPGEGLTIRHDSFDRTSFVQGVALAVRKIDNSPQFLVGIDSLL